MNDSTDALVINRAGWVSRARMMPTTFIIKAREPRQHVEHQLIRASIVADLKQSFVFLRAGIDKLTDADAERKMPWFDGENTYRGILYFFTRHTGEHTGQLIAYARVNGITPPWSDGR